MKEFILKKKAFSSIFEEIKPSLIPHMHDSMLYKLNITADKIAENSQIEEKAVFKQDTSNIESEGDDMFDIFYIGGS